MVCFASPQKTPNKTTLIFVNNTVCVVNSQILVLFTQYMHSHDTKTPYLSAQYWLCCHAPHVI